MTSLMVPRTFIQRKLPSQSCSRLSLQALRTRVRRNSSEVCQKTTHCLTHSIPACSQHAICMMDCAVPMPAAPKLEHGQMLL